MKKLNVAVIGQGRSGRDIHGAFFRSESNEIVNVVAVVELDPERRERALVEYPGCTTYSDYRELFGRTDIDVVVNASFSEMHYEIGLDLIKHGFNVVQEKPMGRNRYECDNLINEAKRAGVMLAVFQQSLFAPMYTNTQKIIASGKLGKVEQVSLRYNGLARRWDWQTLQCKLAGSVYNTGPHPIGYALGFLDFDNEAKVVYSRLATALTSGDGEDYAKILITAPGKPLVDIEISAIDAFSDYVIKVQGTRGTLKVRGDGYVMKYIVDGENEERPVQYESLKNAEGLPMYCSEKLITHTEEGANAGSAFDSAVAVFYSMVHQHLFEGKPLTIKPEDIAKVVGVIEKVHADNPLPVIYPEKKVEAR